MTVRTRVAPSPTGEPHVGTAYVALFNWVFARQHGGRFILRIEDTDRERSDSVSEAMIIEALRWAGIDWDEGPDREGPCGPYRQSERGAIYRRHVRDLIDGGHAFYCFCGPDRLDALRRAQRERGATSRYDGLCAGLDPEVSASRVEAGEPHVVRMRVPPDGVCRFGDRLRGTIEIPWSQVDMQVLLKSDGFPTYHLAVVVDDHLMGITHVLRGDDWINSMPKHALLYRHFGWDMPEHAHLPLLRNPDRSKLSKRKNPASLHYFRDVGYLPEALLNYLGLMGWSMPDEREVFGIDEMVAEFDLDRVSTGGPVFDLEKLNWLNGQYIRRLTPDQLADRVGRWALNRDRLARLVPLIQSRTERFIDIAPQVDYLLGERRELSADLFEHRTLTAAECKRVLHHALAMMATVRPWDSGTLMGECRALAGAMDIRLRDFLFPLFVAVSGRATALPLFDSMAFLGPDLTRTRLRSALAALGGISKKATKRLDKDFAALARGSNDRANN
ncbi:MAG: glutamate--tRNA ligase [Gammaproteobacteria bacterium]|nr:glutamate--tRNA ligase [Gammaproteobacteria bacterium]